MKPFTHFAFASLLALEALALPKFFTGFSKDIVGPADAPWSNGYINSFHQGTTESASKSKPATTSSAAPAASSSSVSTASTGTAHQSGGENYIVFFKNGASASGSDIKAADTVSTSSTDDLLSQMGLTSDHADVRHTFDGTGVKGFAASLQSHCLDKLANMSDVIVEKDMIVSTHATTARSGGPWGLERISTTSTVSGDPSTLDFTYNYDNTALGSGVDIYVVDTGINTAHVAFNGRATVGWAYDPTNNADGDGHGTHVSGTAAGSTFGVASMANLIGVKVLDNSGTGQASDTVQGIQWVINQHNQRKSDPSFVGSIMSMSWGLSASKFSAETLSPHLQAVLARYTSADFLLPTGSQAIDTVIQQAVSAGIHAAVASGNQGTDSCSSSPSANGGSQGPAVSVGSVGSANAISSFSNSGACTDVYAPGENVISAWIGGNNVINTLDGTSMATPHVTGVMAYSMVANPQLAQDPQAMKNFIVNGALKNVVSGNAQSGDAKLLLNNGVTGALLKVKREESVVERAVNVLSGLFNRRQTFHVAEGVSRLRY